MNLYALAEKDLAATLENAKTGGGREMILVDPNGNETALVGTIGDIGFLLDTDGQPIPTRSIVACFRMSSFVSGGNYVIPCDGWKVRYKDMAAQEWLLFVERAEPDRTLGICRLILTLDLSESRENQNG